MTDGAVSVCVLSDQPIVAAGTRAVLSEYSSLSLKFEFVEDHRLADVVIYDTFRLATAEGGDRARELRDVVAAHPGRVLALSRLLQPRLTARALAAGAVAPVAIGADADELVGLVEALVGGGLALDSELAAQHLASLTRGLRTDVGLTAREESVLARIAAGYTNPQIAAEFFISINTVKTTIRNAYQRIGVRSRSQAVAWAIEHGYASQVSGGPPGRSGCRLSDG